MTNKSVFEALEKIASITTSQASMFTVDNRYAHPPFLRFRFTEFQKGHPVYTKLKILVNQFKGKMEWDIVDSVNSKNYVLLPKAFLKSLASGSFYDGNINRLIIENYDAKIDDAITDIPFLADWIKSQKIGIT